LSIRADGYEDLRAAIVNGELLPGERLIEEELSARLGLGRAAVRMALVRLEHDGPVERERRLRGDGDLIALSNANARLHAEILEASGHETAKRLSRTLSSQIVRFQYRTVLLPGRPERSLAEHAGIVEAIAGRDPDAAEQAMQRHLLHVADALRTHHDGAAAPDAPLAASTAQD
jgi:DNA-binding GntR family transcriptional regulator